MASDRMFGLGFVLAIRLPGVTSSGFMDRSSPIPLRVSPGVTPEFPTSDGAAQYTVGRRAASGSSALDGGATVPVAQRTVA